MLSDQRSLIRAAGAALAVSALLAIGGGTAIAAGNVNFVGVWNSSAGGWVIKTENLSTGACTGTSDFTGYTLTACKVTGNQYKFTVNYGATYHSYNSGTINGNSVSGSFTDTNGTSESYTATRTVMCIVPKLAGKTLASAKKALKSAHCGVGKVTKKKSSKVKSGRIISSSPKAGRTEKQNAKVALKVSKGKH